MALTQHFFITALRKFGIYPFIKPRMSVNCVQSYPQDSAPKAATVKLKFSFNCSEPNFFQLNYLNQVYHNCTYAPLFDFIKALETSRQNSSFHRRVPQVLLLKLVAVCGNINLHQYSTRVCLCVCLRERGNEICRNGYSAWMIGVSHVAIQLTVPEPSQLQSSINSFHGHKQIKLKEDLIHLRTAEYLSLKTPKSHL